MTLHYTVRGQVRITIISYANDILADFNKAQPKGGSTKSRANPNNLFAVNKDCKKLKQIKIVQFHNLTAKTSYDTKQERPDTCTAIKKFTNRVRAPN